MNRSDSEKSQYLFERIMEISRPYQMKPAMDEEDEEEEDEDEEE